MVLSLPNMGLVPLAPNIFSIMMCIPIAFNYKRQNLLLTVEQQKRVAESMVDMGDANDFPSIPVAY